ncbi:MAG: nucleotidyltransferase family protein, partial [bacterium]|nr:nucleotidyltransferase family protein [bacterium]
AVYDKYLRTEMALRGGADLVLELPNAFAVSSAEDFAACGVALLDKLAVVSHLCFGSEHGNVAPFSFLASLLAEEPPAYSKLLRHSLKKGLSFPAARQEALTTFLRSQKGMKEEVELLLQSPNNILSLEYCKALLRRNSPILPLTIRREGMGYHDTLGSFSSNEEKETKKAADSPFHSATSIRQMLEQAHSLKALSEAVPSSTLLGIQEGKPLFLNDLSPYLNYALLAAAHTQEGFFRYADFSEELAERLHTQLLSPVSFEERIFQLKSKQYTYTRISRALLHLLLHITEENLQLWKSPAVDFAPYARVLGFRASATPLLKAIKQHSSLPLITRPKEAERSLAAPALSLFRQDLFASHFYQSVVQAKYQSPAKNEYQAGRKLFGFRP